MRTHAEVMEKGRVMTEKILTIAIVNYKTPKMVCDVVQSAKDHALLDNVRVVIAVVDNGSGDGSVDIIRNAHPDIDVIDAGANLGFAAGNNLVLRRAKTPYIMLLNSDAFLQSGALRRVIDFMESHPRAGMAGPRILNPDGTDQDYPCRFPTVPEMIRRALKGPQFPAHGATGPVPMDRIHGCCLVLRRAILDQVGLMDEQFFMYDEDMDWCLRTRNAGWELYLLPDATVIHLGGQSSGRAPSGVREKKTAPSFNPRMSYELRKSRYILYRKHRNFFELTALKFFTDSVLLAKNIMLLLYCLLLLPDMWKHEKKYFDGALRRIKGNFSIMAINPFRLEVQI